MGAKAGFQAASCCHVSSIVVPPVQWPYKYTGNLINLEEETAADKLPWDSQGNLEVVLSPYGVFTVVGTL